ncbi:unnamed protein product [Nippostrongylus brasiliensis]|uniref:MFS domain-containing protein n=1 Tax=Nippostrongylus brasiliensis TaxID=27835 RepID=A0A0N4YJ55_NIPBR|nr:unnamed protein product [Nippostrongylus brasiliensis]
MSMCFGMLGNITGPMMIGMVTKLEDEQSSESRTITETASCTDQNLTLSLYSEVERGFDVWSDDELSGMGSEDDSVDAKTEKVPYYPLFSPKSTRLLICFMLATGLYATVSMRVNLSMAVVCMVNSTAYATERHVSKTNISSSSPQCQSPNSDSESAAQAGYTGDLLWSPTMQSILFSATFYGGLASIVFAGVLADRCGPKSIGFMFPCLASLVGRWFAAAEKSTVAALYTSGNQIAASTTSLISSYLCTTSFGWPSIFYLYGAVGCVWLALFYLIVTNSPTDNRFISDDEKAYLAEHVKHSKDKSTGVAPIRAMLTCTPLIAAVLCNFTYNLQASLFQAFLPTFLKEELMLPLNTNGFYSMTPFITQLISKNILGILADYLKRHGILGHTRSAKIFQSLGSFGSAVLLIMIATIPSCENPYIALPLLALYGIFFSAGICGFFTCLLCIAPPFSGTITSISMFFGMLGNISGPMMIGMVTKLPKFNLGPIGRPPPPEPPELDEPRPFPLPEPPELFDPRPPPPPEPPELFDPRPPPVPEPPELFDPSPPSCREPPVLDDPSPEPPVVSGLLAPESPPSEPDDPEELSPELAG